MVKHLVIPDVQVKPGHNFDFLHAIGNYIVDKQPEVVVCIGDFADMTSLSSYDVGTKDFEGRRYRLDVEATKDAMATLLAPLRKYQAQQKNNKKRVYNPRLVLTLGNHENRINKVVSADPKLDGTLSIDNLEYTTFGWEVYSFLQPIVIDDVAYCHYFTSGVMGRPVASARHLVQKKHMSCTMGHVQNWEMHREVRGDGQPILGLFAGSCYLHNEDYLGPQGNTYARGIWLKNEVCKGDYQPMFVSLKFLTQKFI